MAGRWLFRCDATESTGLGHLSRCLALAEAARQRGISSSFLGEYDAFAARFLNDSGFSALPFRPEDGPRNDVRQTILAAQSVHSCTVVADSYGITNEWLGDVQREMPLIFLDDFCQLESYPCAGMLNFTVEAPALEYPGIDRARCALGPAFFPARQALVRLRQAGTCNATGPVERLLVAIGGVDRTGLAAQAVEAVEELFPGLSVRAIWSRPESMPSACHGAVAWIPRGEELATHLAWCDACLSGGGLIKYECAYLGVPAGVLSQTEEQQRETGRFCEAGLACDLGFHPKLEDLKTSVAKFLGDSLGRHAISERALSVFPPEGPFNAVSAALSWT